MTSVLLANLSILQFQPANNTNAHPYLKWAVATTRRGTTSFQVSGDKQETKIDKTSVVNRKQPNITEIHATSSKYRWPNPVLQIHLEGEASVCSHPHAVTRFCTSTPTLCK